ncbi:MAG: hypothetical protein KDA69_00385 [Planctomycetaceae bacterium]|nr:hypothetical protein [Planctomycetaceae bacterium]MCA9029689.1 hypothetical protein [Planctomycetaceae bacterium]MCA9042741.1 hypothetical protein [Planctomycetaceae bacterium]MCB9951204.1 hypothetical protein [Planctomycetaceae bacterium]
MNATNTDERTWASALPLVVRVGFSGSRNLYPAGTTPDEAGQFDKQLVEKLVEILESLPKKLNWAPAHFVCGVSSLATGADTLFAQALRSRGMGHRVFLPQHRDEFLNAVGSSGPDFSAEQQDQALRILESPGTIQECVVSDSPNRHERFAETNLEILRVADLLICLQRQESANKPGGAQSTFETAKNREMPTLELRVRVTGNELQVVETWHFAEKFEKPYLLEEMVGLPVGANVACVPLPTTPEYCAVLKNFGSGQAKLLRNMFNVAAFAIILTHVVATLMGTFGFVTHTSETVHNALLWLEFLLLAAGLGFHEYLHLSHTGKNWALSRIVAEVCRSAIMTQQFPVYLAYLFRLPIPDKLKSVLATINVVHMTNTAKLRTGGKSMSNPAVFLAARDEYLATRIDRQLQYYTSGAQSADFWRNFARKSFTLFSFLAVTVAVYQLSVAHGESALLGAIGFVLPVIAVSAMSLASAADLDARSETYHELAKFLSRQKLLMARAETFHEFRPLLLEAEERLLGETANWYSRRAYLGVA